MHVLYIAEIVGKAGIYALKKGLPLLKERFPIDFVIACGDRATGGGGLGKNHAAYIRKLGAQAITTGECCFYKKDLTEDLNRIPYVIRPENLNAEAPGLGARVFKAGEWKVGLAVLLGQSCFTRLHGDNPWSRLPILLERLHQETRITIIDFHAQASGEKQSLLYLAAGRCSGVIGSHNRVQTTDERVLQGTAFITDAGRTGSTESVGGTDPATRIGEYLSGIPEWTREALARPELQGLLLDIDNRGTALSIERIRLPVPEIPHQEEKVLTE